MKPAVINYLKKEIRQIKANGWKVDEVMDEELVNIYASLWDTTPREIRQTIRKLAIQC